VTLARGFTTTFAGIAINQVPGFIAAQLLGAAAAAGVCAVLFSPSNGRSFQAVEPGENDSAVEIEAESAWVMDRLGPDVPLHFTAFHPDWKLMDALPTPAKTLRMARRIAMNVGIHYVYTGNVHDPVGQSTHCHAYSAVLIGRDQYAVTAWNLSADGRCAECDTRCPGVFGAMAGRWGRRRQPVGCEDASQNR
jgi:pyruvate formate lyase activating enzyme